MKRCTKISAGWAVAILAVSFKQHASGQNCIVKDGQPMAEIVTAENPCSSVKLAARELQVYVKKIKD